MRSGVRISPSAPSTIDSKEHSHRILADSEGVFVCEESQKPLVKSRHVGNKLGNLLTTSEASKLLGVTERTVRNWCESGQLPALSKPYGKKIRYFINPTEIEVLKAQAELDKTSAPKEVRQEQKSKRPHAEFIRLWMDAMAQGLLTGKPFSKNTISDYERHIKPFLITFTECRENTI
jgi:excisionase family DNA binding protein